MPALVVVNDLNLLGSRRAPAEADAPLIVDADTELALAIAFKRLKSIAGRGTQELECCRRASFRVATLTIDPKRADLPVSKSLRVSLHLKLLITAQFYNA